MNPDIGPSEGLAELLAAEGDGGDETLAGSSQSEAHQMRSVAAQRVWEELYVSYTKQGTNFGRFG